MLPIIVSNRCIGTTKRSTNSHERKNTVHLHGPLPTARLKSNMGRLNRIRALRANQTAKRKSEGEISVKREIEQEFQRLNIELLAEAGNSISLADKILYANLANQIENVRHEFGQVIGKVGKEKTALGATNTESGMQKESITKNITIIVNCKDRLPPQVQQFIEDFISMENAIRELQRKYI